MMTASALCGATPSAHTNADNAATLVIPDVLMAPLLVKFLDPRQRWPAGKPVFGLIADLAAIGSLDDAGTIFGQQIALADQVVDGAHHTVHVNGVIRISLLDGKARVAARLTFCERCCKRNVLPCQRAVFVCRKRRTAQRPSRVG